METVERELQPFIPPSEMDLQLGSIVRTSYNTGPYIVLEVLTDCTCPRYEDEISLANPPASAPHMHLTCACIVHNIEGKELAWLNGYADCGGGRIQSVWCKDELFVVGLVSAQLSLFPDGISSAASQEQA